MTEPRNAAVVVALFFFFNACLVLDSLHHHRFGSHLSRSRTSLEMPDPEDPFLDAQEKSTHPGFALPCAPPTDPEEVLVHQHGWPVAAIDYTAAFDVVADGQLCALHHLPRWRVHWLCVTADVCLYCVVSWLASLCMGWGLIRLGARLSLQSLFAITFMVAFELSWDEPTAIPERVHPLIFRAENLVAGVSDWVSTIACYVSVFVAFYPKFIYRETSRWIAIWRARKENGLDATV